MAQFGSLVIRAPQQYPLIKTRKFDRDARRQGVRYQEYCDAAARSEIDPLGRSEDVIGANQTS